MKKTWEINYINLATGDKSKFVYVNSDNFADVDVNAVKQVYGVCFYEEKMVVVNSKTTWTLPGGTREDGGSVEQTLRREIQEETNMEILEWKPIGIQIVYEENIKPYLQLRTVCKVKPFGPFVSDPDHDILEIKLIDPNYYRTYFDWGEIGEVIISRAKKLLQSIH